MQKNFGQNDPKIVEYVERLLLPEDDVLRGIRLRAKESGLPEIQVGPLDALHLEVLVRAIGAKKIVEIGTLGGYSGTALCRGMGGDGRLWTCELQETNAHVAKKNFQVAGVLERVQILIGPALKTLSTIESKGPFDLVFIDADKVSYPHYLDWARKNLKLGGVVLADNTFGWGMVPEGSDGEAGDQDRILALRGLREFNKKIASTESGFRVTMLPTGEGLTFGVKVS